MREDKLQYCTKHHTSYVTECHSCYREKTECIHSVPFDSGECIEDKKIVNAGKSRGFIIEEVSCKEKLDSSLNNGGKTDYYDLPKDAKCCQDIIEWRNMNFQQGNIFKVAFTFNQGRHDATTYERELNKIIYFAQRELERIKC